MFRTALIAALALVCMASNAEARQRHKAIAILSPDCTQNGGLLPCEAPPDLRKPLPSDSRIVVKMHRDRSQLRRSPRVARVEIKMHRIRSDVIDHPPGCPARAFCGCGASVRVFGRPVRELWLAANWFKFPRSPPAPGNVAVRRHHVFVLEQKISDDVWQVYDANSGQHLTRRHARSIAGYVIVNPREPST